MFALEVIHLKVKMVKVRSNNFMLFSSVCESKFRFFLQISKPIFTGINFVYTAGLHYLGPLKDFGSPFRGCQLWAVLFGTKFPKGPLEV